MTTIQEIQKIEDKNKVLKSASELFYARENIVDYFKEGIFLIKVMYLNQKKKISRRIRRRKSKIFLNTLRKNQKT